jgi:hypothetical protein
MFSKFAWKRDAARKQPTLLTIAGLPVLAALVCAGAPHASAAPYIYTFTGGTSISWEDGHTDAVSGDFTYDATTSTLSNVDIVLTGTGPEAGTYNLPDNPETSPRLAFFGSQGYISLNFVTALSGLSDDLTNPVPAPTPPPLPPGTTLYQEFCGFCASGGQVYESTDSGGVTAAAAPVPEPPSGAILAAALGVLLLGRLAFRRTPQGTMELILGA